MNFFIAVFGGAFVGAVAALFLFNIRSQDLLLINILAGLIGGIMGFVVYTVFLASFQQGSTDFTPAGIVSDVLGALILVLLINFIQSLRRRGTKHKDIEHPVG